MTPRSDAPSTPDSGDAAHPSTRRRRRLDGRTIGICVCIALAAAIAAGLVVSLLAGDDDGDDTPSASLTPAADVDRDDILTAEVTTFDDEPTTVADQLQGRPMVVNLWSTWCAPCIDEMPEIEKVHQANEGSVDFLGIDVKDQKDDAEEMIERTGVTYPSLQDRSGGFVTAADATVLPVTLLLDADGTVVDTHTGPLDEAELQEMIDTKLR